MSKKFNYLSLAEFLDDYNLSDIEVAPILEVAPK